MDFFINLFQGLTVAITIFLSLFLLFVSYCRYNKEFAIKAMGWLQNKVDYLEKLEQEKKDFNNNKKR